MNRNNTLSPSYLEDRDRKASDVPRYALHFYALTIGDGINTIGESTYDARMDRTVTRFTLPDFAGHALVQEFPELKGIRFVDLTEENGNITKVETTPYFGVYVKNGRENYAALGGYKTPEEAFESMTEMLKSPHFAQGIFMGQQPFIAAMNDQVPIEVQPVA